MATLLTKDLTRESTEVVDDRNLIVTLTEGQEIEMRLKGTRSAPKSISILELYENLSGGSPKESPQGSSKSDNGRLMVSLYDLRSANAISTMSYEDKVKFERIIVDLISINF